MECVRLLPGPETEIWTARRGHLWTHDPASPRSFGHDLSANLEEVGGKGPVAPAFSRLAKSKLRIPHAASGALRGAAILRPKTVSSVASGRLPVVSGAALGGALQKYGSRANGGADRNTSSICGPALATLH